MKIPRISRRLILCAVLVLATVGMFLVPAASVTAAEQEWPLQLVGATTVNISQAEFEAMAAATPSNTYTDSDNNTWRGLALWRLIALVDDGDPATFNSALASVYTISLTAADGYVKNVVPGDWVFAGSEDVFVANEVQLDETPDFVELPLVNPLNPSKMWYPLRVNGSGCAFSSQRVGALVKVELLNLPVTAVGVSPASQAVDNGASFTLDLAIDTDTASRGWQANVAFDAAKMQCTGVTEGGFLLDYAIANGGGTVSGGAATIDNVVGTVTIPGYAITGAGSGGPTGTGTLCTLAFTANAAVDAFAAVSLSGVVVSDVLGVIIPGPVVTGGTVAIGDVPMPDLVVSALSATKDGDGTYTIAYTITNQGNDDAVACSTSIVVDGGAPIVVACPALLAGESDTQTLPAQAFTSPTDTILVTADSADAVSESSELNNATEIVYALASDGGNVIINGNILAKLELTVPADILSWVLKQGPNSISGAANVKCNTPWQLQVNDQDANTNGHMTKWQTDVYDTSVKLANALYVGCESTVALSGSNQLIADGVVDDQDADNGQDLAVTFSQQVLYSDPVLGDGYTYHIVVTFTASSTF
ncbi:MAG: hypothetical protein JW753_01270 [Dehalococcoidia bacterium]|nr:hypothetical protein [Dehalococcoidia bacterium]